MLKRQQQPNTAKQGNRKLRRGRAVIHAEPGLINAGGEAAHREMLHRAEISQRFHQSERNARGQGGARQGQRNMQEAACQPMAQSAGCLDQANALLQEGGAAEHVNVRVKHHGKDQRRAGQAADFREPILPEGKPGCAAKRGLHRPGYIQQPSIDIAAEVSGHGDRQQQRHFQKAPPTEFAGHHQPGGDRARTARHQRDQQGQQRGIGQHFGQGGGRDMPPDLAPRRGGGHQHGHDRRCHGESHQ